MKDDAFWEDIGNLAQVTDPVEVFGEMMFHPMLSFQVHISSGTDDDWDEPNLQEDQYRLVWF
jgi:hypothetical protein